MTIHVMYPVNQSILKIDNHTIIEIQFIPLEINNYYYEKS